jgi:hypothetical protein
LSRSGICALCNLVVNEALNGTSLEQMLGNDLRNVLLGYTAIERAVGINDDNGTECAKTEASGLNDLNFLCKSLLVQLAYESVLDLLAAGRGTSRTATA